MTGKPCAKCAKVHDRAKCVGHNNAGQPCGLYPVRGAKVCHKHGAGAPQVKAAAARRRQQEQANTAARTFGLPIEIDPQTALLEEVQRTAGIVAWLEVEIRQAVDQSEGTAGLKQTDASGKFERPSVEVELYDRNRRHLASVAKSAIDAGIEERRVKLAEAQGDLLGQVISNVLADVFGLFATAGIAADLLRRIQREQVPQVVRTRLMETAELFG